MTLYYLAAHSSLWIVNALYFIAICFQIYRNYKERSVKGLSDLMLFGYVCAYVAQIFYVFTMNLPTSCQVMIPLCLWAVVIMVVQRFIYRFGKGYMHTFVLSYIFFLTVVIIAVPIAYHYRHLVGEISGWIAFVLWAVYQIPQMIKIYHEKSTKGFSLSFVVTMTLAGIVELISSLILKLPLASIVTIVRGIIFNGIFLAQFYVYRY